MEKTTAGILADLDRGRFALYIDGYLSGEVSDPLVRAELAGYLGRLDEMREALDELAPSERRTILEAEYALAANEDPETAAEPLKSLTSARAALGLARLAHRRSQMAECAAAAILARELAEVQNDSLTLGRAIYLEGVVASEQGDVERAADRVRNATTHLAAESGRYLAYAEGCLGHILCAGPKRALGLRYYELAYRRALDVGHLGDIYLHGLCYLIGIFGDGHYGRVLDDIADIIDGAQHPAHVDSRLSAERLQISAMLAAGKWSAALDAAAEHLDASLAGSEMTQLYGEAVYLRARAHAGEYDALGAFADVAARAETLDSGHAAALVKAWWWSSILQLDPIVAELRREELRGPAEAFDSAFIAAELRAIDAAPRPVRMVRPGVIEIDYNGPDAYPRAKVVDAVTEAMDFRSATALTDGVFSRMEELSGRDKSFYSKKAARYGIEPHRPGRRQKDKKQLPKKRRKPVNH